MTKFFWGATAALSVIFFGFVGTFMAYPTKDFTGIENLFAGLVGLLLLSGLIAMISQSREDAERRRRLESAALATTVERDPLL